MYMYNIKQDCTHTPLIFHFYRAACLEHLLFIHDILKHFTRNIKPGFYSITDKLTLKIQQTTRDWRLHALD